MKFPKHRANLYLVERWTYANNSTVVVGAFNNVVAADDFKGECEQAWLDTHLMDDYPQNVVFNVVLCTYYDS